MQLTFSFPAMTNIRGKKAVCLNYLFDFPLPSVYYI